MTIGWSGGGAARARLCRAARGALPRAATIAGAAPPHEPDLCFMAGMGDDNVEEFSLAFEGREALLPAIEALADPFREITAGQVVDALGGLLSGSDLQALEGPLADYVAASGREAVRVGPEGWVEDDLAFCREWGFNLESVTVPVAVWQGREDLMVPASHGEWLAAHVPGARPHLLEGVGHVALVARVGEILEDLAQHRRPSGRE